MSKAHDSLSHQGKYNISRNREKWGSQETWETEYKWGYQYNEREIQYEEMRDVFDRFLVPYVPKRKLDILEIAPGGGKGTVDLIPLARKLTLLDLNEECIQLCKERFKYYDHIEYCVNDGASMDMIEDNSMDLIVSWAAFVHIHVEVVEAYVKQFRSKLKDKGVMWIHHSARGQNKLGWRSDMSVEKMAKFAEDSGLVWRAQIGHRLIFDPEPFYLDCISIMQRVDKKE